MTFPADDSLRTDQRRFASGDTGADKGVTYRTKKDVERENRPSRLEQAQQAVANATDSFRHKAAEVGESVKETAVHAKDYVADKGSKAASAVKNKVADAESNARSGDNLHDEKDYAYECSRESWEGSNTTARDDGQNADAFHTRQVAAGEKRSALDTAKEKGSEAKAYIVGKGQEIKERTQEKVREAREYVAGDNHQENAAHDTKQLDEDAKKHMDSARGDAAVLSDKPTWARATGS